MTKKVLHFPERKDKLKDYNNQPCFSVLYKDDKFLMKVQKFRLSGCKSSSAERNSVYGSVVIDDEEITVFINDSSHPNKHYAIAKLFIMPLGTKTSGMYLSTPRIDEEEKAIDLVCSTNTPTSYWDTEDV